MKNILDLKSYLHFLGRNKLYAAVTIVGFASALMFVVLMALFTRNQFSVEKTQPKKDRLFVMTYDGNQCAFVPPPLPADILGRYPEIEAGTRIGWFNKLVKTGTSEKMAASGMLVDSSFFNMFSYPFVAGDAATALATDNDVVLTESFALKLFGSTNVVGKTFELCVMDNIEVRVGGVMKDFNNAIFDNRIEIIMRVGVMKNDLWRVEGYGACNYSFFVLTTPGANLNSKTEDMVAFFKDDLKFWLFSEGFRKTVGFAPLQSAYFDIGRGSNQRRGDFRFVMILLAAALVILIFAVINYINLSVAQSGFRAKEMASRRLLGASKGEIFGRFIFESVFICFISLLLAVLLAWAAQPFFNSVLQTNLFLAKEFTPFNILLALCFILFLGLVSGVVPAYVITKFKAVDVVKGAFSYKTKKVYSKLLIVFQYFITIVLIGSTLVIEQQTSFMRNKKLGYNSSNLYIASCYVDQEDVAGMRSRLESVAGVEAVSFAEWLPFYGGNNNTFVSNDVQQSFTVYSGDSMLMEILGMEILERTGNDADSAYWINETGLKNLGLSKVTDKISVDDNPMGGYPLRGVVKDYHFNGLSQPISSAIINEECLDVSKVLMKLSSSDVLESIKPIFYDVSGGAPFFGEWADDIVKYWSDKEYRQGQLIGCLSLIAIIISSLGMLAMATYFMQQRAVEVALRKVIGATKREVLRQLMWRFIKMVLVGYVFALPATWYFCSEWLKDFPYKVDINPMIYVNAGAMAVLVASATIFWQAYKAMQVPPSVVLKK